MLRMYWQGDHNLLFATVTYVIKDILNKFRKEFSSDETAIMTTLQNYTSDNNLPSHWINHITVGMIRKTWSAYKKDNPTPEEQELFLLNEPDREIALPDNDFDEFVHNAYRFKIEEPQRKLLKESIFAHLLAQHEK